MASPFSSYASFLTKNHLKIGTSIPTKRGVWSSTRITLAKHPKINKQVQTSFFFCRTLSCVLHAATSKITSAIRRLSIIDTTTSEVPFAEPMWIDHKGFLVCLRIFLESARDIFCWLQRFGKNLSFRGNFSWKFSIQGDTWMSQEVSKRLVSGLFP